MAEGLDVLSKVNVPLAPGAMALPVLFPNWMEAPSTEPVQPAGAVMLVVAEGRSKLPWIQPYQKALIGLLPVLFNVNKYLKSAPDFPVSVRVAVAMRVPAAWRPQAAKLPATVRAKQIFIFIYF